MLKKVILLMAITAAAPVAPVENTYLSDDVRIREVRQDSMRGIEVVFRMNTSRESVWTMLTDYANYRVMFPDVEKLELFHEDADGAEVAFTFDLVIKRARTVLYRKYSPGHNSITWRQTSGDFKCVEGSWNIESQADDSVQIITYRSFVEYEGMLSSLMNPAIVEGAKGRARAMAERMRNHVKKR